MALTPIHAANSTYAMANRSVKICAGDNPSINSTFVLTKVVPQITTVMKASRWQNSRLLVIIMII